MGKNSQNELLLELFRDKVICTDKSLGTWYMYDGKQWKKTYQRYVIDEICKLFTDDDEISTYCTENILSDSEFISELFEKCTDLLFDSKFTTDLNRNINLLNFENGTYHILEKELRPHSYKDRISFSTHTNFDIHSNFTDDIDDALQKLIPETKLRDKFMTDLTSCFYRSGFDEKEIYNLTGYSESFVQKIKDSFGDYFSEDESDIDGKKIILLRNPTEESIDKVKKSKAVILIYAEKPIYRVTKLELHDITEDIMKYLLQMVIL